MSNANKLACFPHCYRILACMLAEGVASSSTAKGYVDLRDAMKSILGGDEEVPDFSTMSSALDLLSASGCVDACNQGSRFYVTQIGRTFWEEEFGLLGRMNEKIIERE